MNEGVNTKNVACVIKNKSSPNDVMEQHQISGLLQKLPQLDKIMEIHRKIGEGTFSSVFLGSLRKHALLPECKRHLFAIKHLVPTTHPARIEHELRCLRDLGGKDNIIGVELCLRNFDTVVFIMPYIPHCKFSDYFQEMDANELRAYLRALLIALRRVHACGVIHRDIKPSNFLYDRENKRYQLVDFGLAQRLANINELKGSRTTSRTTYSHPQDENEDSEPKAKRSVLDTSERNEVVKQRMNGRASVVRCICRGRGAVCAACASRQAPRAARAGTQGFRPPEVLLKYPHQTTAVDIWACGVVTLSILSGRYPFFRAVDDVGALAELVSLFGTRTLQRTAHSLGRELVTSCVRRGLSIRKLCEHLRSTSAVEHSGTSLSCCDDCSLLKSKCVCQSENSNNTVTSEEEKLWGGFPTSVFSLTARLLDPDPRTRITAVEALQHPFIADDN